jgi:cell division protein ZapA (FtsZ GTPase activity inhibitor)
VYQVTKRQIALTLDELSIKVNIADRTYPLTVKADEEEKVRKAAKLINDKLKAYSNQFAVRDKQDIISMCALELATELISTSN